MAWQLLLGIAGAALLATFEITLIRAQPNTLGVAPYTPYAAITDDVWPTWSPDDRRIAYTKLLPPSRGKLYVVGSAGGVPRILFNDSFSYGQPAWAPNGQRIAFTCDRGGSLQIWTADADGTDLKQVTAKGDYNVQPNWSPDGKQIAFVSYPTQQIYLIPAGGGESKSLASGFNPAFSPDGHQMAFIVEGFEQAHATLSIFVAGVEGGAPRRLVSSTQIGEATGYTPTVDWSPDGRSLLTTRLVGGTWRITVIEVASDRIDHTILLNGSALNPRWSHDGKRIAFTSSDTGHPGNLATIAVDGRHQIETTKARAYHAARLVRYTSAGGLEIPAYLFVPHFPAYSKWPALVWLHGGLGGAFLDQFDPRVQYFVEQGFVVLAPNYRSSGGFEDKLALLGPKDDIVPDILGAADYLKASGFTDLAHIGILGESLGGYLAMLSIARHPTRFAAAVEFFGPSDLVETYGRMPEYRSLLKTMIGGTPAEKPEVYREASPSVQLLATATPLLMLCGTDDEPAYHETVKLAERLKQAHKEYEFISFRGAGHGFTGNDQIEAMQQSLRFVSARLKP